MMGKVTLYKIHLMLLLALAGFCGGVTSSILQKFLYR